MLDKQDTFTRWYQGILGVVIFFVSVFLIVLSWSYSSFGYRDLLGVLGFGGFYISFRCLWYAITGQDNVNRDDS